jgi:hypothetical protein
LIYIITRGSQDPVLIVHLVNTGNQQIKGFLLHHFFLSKNSIYQINGILALLTFKKNKMSQKNSGPPITQEDNYFAPKNWMKKLKVNSPFLAPFMSKKNDRKYNNQKKKDKKTNDLQNAT